MLGATLEEQVAGLLHDISHLAFSHLSEWVFADGGYKTESFNEDLTLQFLKNSEIDEILKKYGFKSERIADLEKFHLLKKKAPDLAADRVDYGLRDMKKYLEVEQEKIDWFIGTLDIWKKTIVFNNLKAASEFSFLFLRLQSELYGGFEAVFRYYFFSKLLKKAIRDAILSKEDFFKDEDHVMGILESRKENYIKRGLKILSNPDLSQLEGVYDDWLHKKFRFVDPLVLVNEKVERLSDVDSKFKEKLEFEKKENEKGVYV
jgi:hypothetical protein